ncbi:DUF4291 family protein [Streptomyces echinatus]|uniref:DUF4291 family protein n=1 Tax=Streptomyces echinatus TaxID=67293 RepID=UPI00380F61A9
MAWTLPNKMVCDPGLTWIKPSFLWMMYRSGWARKPNQERILRIEMDRAGFEWALAHSALSHFLPGVHADREQWRAGGAECPVRVQWDPDRSIHLEPQPWRAIQVDECPYPLPEHLRRRLGADG